MIGAIKQMASLSLIILLVIVLIVWHNCMVSRNKIELNHVFCFSVGYVFYCLVPIWFFLLNEIFEDPIYNNLVKIYESIDTWKQVGYILISFIFYLSFIVGTWSVSKYRVTIGGHKLFHDRYFEFNMVEKVIFIPVFLLGVFLIYRNRVAFGIGYTGESLAGSSLSAYEFLLNAFVLMYICTNSARYKIKKLLINKWVIWFTLYSILLLTTGGRLYVITSFMSEVVFYSCIKMHGLNIKKTGFYMFLTVIILGAIGMLRMGVTRFGFSNMIVNVLGESLFTSWSTVTYIKNYSIINLFGSMKVALSGLINMVPSFIYPEKAIHIYMVRDVYPLSEAPLGASHFFLNFNGGLGLIPSMLFFFFLGRMLEGMHTEISKKGLTSKVIYCLVTANTLFTLFRDPFSISVVKNILELSVIFPWLIIWIGGSIHHKDSMLGTSENISWRKISEN